MLVRLDEGDGIMVDLLRAGILHRVVLRLDNQARTLAWRHAARGARALTACLCTLWRGGALQHSRRKSEEGLCRACVSCVLGGIRAAWRAAGWQMKSVAWAASAAWWACAGGWRCAHLLCGWLSQAASKRAASLAPLRMIWRHDGCVLRHDVPAYACNGIKCAGAYAACNHMLSRGMQAWRGVQRRRYPAHAWHVLACSSLTW